MRPDAIVIGAGFVGGAVAHRLAARGRRVLCIDAGDQQPSASLASGAMLGVIGEVVAGEDAADVDLRVEAAKRHASWRRELGDVAAGRGTFVVASARRPSDLAAADAMEEHARRVGAPCARVDARDVSGLRHARGHVPARVLHLPTEGWVSAPAVVGRLRSAVAAAPATAVAIAHRQGRAIGVRTNDGTLRDCDEVIVCAGYATAQLIAASGLGDELMPPLVAAKGVGLVIGTEVAPPHVLRTPNRDFACGVHLVPRSDAVYVGATNRASRFPHLLGRVTAGELADLITDAATELTSAVADADLQGTVWGLRPLSADGRPIVGRTELEGLSVATGTYRNGALLAPLLADLLVSELDGGEANERLSPRRAILPADPAQVLREGLADLVTLLGNPGWDDRVGETLDALADLVVRDGDDVAAMREGMATLLARYGRAEMLPEALVELLQRAGR